MDTLNKNISELNLGELADYMKELKDLKGIINAQEKQVNSKISDLEDQIKERMNTLGTDIIRGVNATVSMSKAEVPSVENWEAFYDYIIENNAPYLLQRRPSVSPIREIWNSGREIEGLDKVTTTTLNFKSI